MKITCTTEKVIEVKESCRKTYCCNKMKIAMNSYKRGKSEYDYISSNFALENDKVRLITHHSYHDGDHSMIAKFCLFCGKPKPRPAPVAAPPKKKHWYQWFK